MLFRRVHGQIVQVLHLDDPWPATIVAGNEFEHTHAFRHLFILRHPAGRFVQGRVGLVIFMSTPCLASARHGLVGGTLYCFWSISATLRPHPVAYFWASMVAAGNAAATTAAAALLRRHNQIVDVHDFESSFAGPAFLRPYPPRCYVLAV